MPKIGDCANNGALILTNFDAGSVDMSAFACDTPILARSVNQGTRMDSPEANQDSLNEMDSSHSDSKSPQKRNRNS